ncbi:MAG: 6,7-dimethyl-8-ribityllumazine synthase [Acidobacteriota bacterium]|jgi:6,7-dimethyl-8-ribityllumazine synthase
MTGIPKRTGGLDARGMKVALIVSRFHEAITSRLLQGAVDCLLRHGAQETDLEVVRVPGSFEIPLVARRIAGAGKVDAVVCLGSLIRGETPHFDLVAAETARGIARAAEGSGIPVVFGVVTAESSDQAAERAGGKAGNRGFDAALTAIEMVDLLRGLDS